MNFSGCYHAFTQDTEDLKAGIFTIDDNGFGLYRVSEDIDLHKVENPYFSYGVPGYADIASQRSNYEV